MASKGFLLSLLVAVGFLGTGSLNVVAQQGLSDPGEYDVKAVFLYQFGQYVVWPKNAVPGDDSTFVIGVLGRNPFGDNLDTIAANKTIQDKKIVIRQFASAKDYQPCHILFISPLADENGQEKTVEDRVKAAVAKTKGSPVLLVADSPGLADKGVMFNFVIEEDKIKLQIKQNAATSAGLIIKAGLLNLKNFVRLVKETGANRSKGPEYHARIS